MDEMDHVPADRHRSRWSLLKTPLRLRPQRS